MNRCAECKGEGPCGLYAAAGNLREPRYSDCAFLPDHVIPTMAPEIRPDSGNQDEKKIFDVSLKL